MENIKTLGFAEMSPDELNNTDGRFLPLGLKPLAAYYIAKTVIVINAVIGAACTISNMFRN